MTILDSIRLLWVSGALFAVACSGDEGGNEAGNDTGAGLGGASGAAVPPGTGGLPWGAGGAHSGPPATCGNGAIDTGEQCDGAMTQTCAQLTMGALPNGVATCNACRFDTTSCTSTGTGAGGSGTGGTSGTGGLDSGGAPPAGGTFSGGGAPPSGGTSSSGGVAPSAGGNPNVGGAPPSSGCLQPGSGKYDMAGPYAVKTLDVDLKDRLPAATQGLTTYRIFYPATMETNCGHPVVAWGNGTTVEGPDVYAFFQNNAASWGVVVIAAGNSNSASQPFLATGLDYMIAQNDDPASPFYRKLSGRNGTSGHSQGAIAATTSTSHASVQAEVQVQGGGVPKAGIAFLALSGTADTIVGTGAPTQSYTRATGPSMLAIYEGADHTGTPTLLGWIQKSPGTIQYVRLHTAWFRCFLADDAAACALFKGGQSCGICSDPGWATLESKNM